jgi:hypothetical protein
MQQWDDNHATTLQGTELQGKDGRRLAIELARMLAESGPCPSAARAASVGGSSVSSVVLNPPRLAGSAVALFDVVVSVHGLGSFASSGGARSTCRCTA